MSHLCISIFFSYLNYVSNYLTYVYVFISCLFYYYLSKFINQIMFNTDMLVNVLKDKCKELKISYQGRKIYLVNRLNEYYATQTST